VLFFTGAAIGNILAAVLAQVTRSRKLTMLIFLLGNAASVAIYLNATGINNQQFIWLCLLIGITGGYLATLVTIAAEQFGTNIRATVTTTVPNFVRGTLIPINGMFTVVLVHFSMIKSSYIMIFGLTAIALLALSRLKESFNKDLDYLEAIETAEPELMV
jgi:MFS transporter, putative metabolite:H+ symporter